jgi:murein DD-endopeptidase MepM/ murein hydrolase activator NlpD
MDKITNFKVVNVSSFIFILIISFLNIRVVSASLLYNETSDLIDAKYHKTCCKSEIILFSDIKLNLCNHSVNKFYGISSVTCLIRQDHNVFFALHRDGTHKHIITVKSDDNLSSICNSLGLNQSVVLKLSKVKKFGSKLTSMKPNEKLEFWISPSGYLMQLDYIPNRLDRIRFCRHKLDFKARLETISPTIKLRFIQGVVTESLFVDSKKVGLPTKVTSQLANIFGWDVDFVQDVRVGDEFYVLYEEEYIHGNKINDKDIVVATYINKGKQITAIRYTNLNGNTSYYKTDGKSMKKAFIRTPVEFTRISSKFNPSRLHPIFKTIQPHHGVDYAAPLNTPIKASGDGVVIFAGWMNGYGNVVKIQHPKNIITVYAHAHSIHTGIKKGKRVKQGDIIAKVGKTGWATGTHLHYEFQVNGKHCNPETVKLPEATPIKGNELKRFKHFVVKMLHLLENHKTYFADNNLFSDQYHNLNLILN